MLYVEELVGPETVNTMPAETIAAFQDHGEVRRPATLTEGVEEAHALLAELAGAGVDYDDVVETFEREGVEKFSELLRRPAQGHRDEAPRSRRPLSEYQGESARGGSRDPAEAGSLRARHLRRLGRPHPAQALPGALRPRVPTLAPERFAGLSASLARSRRPPSSRPNGKPRCSDTPGIRRESVWLDLTDGLRYAADFADEAAEDDLNRVVGELESSKGLGGNRVYYLAIPPQAFETSVREIGERQDH